MKIIIATDGYKLGHHRMYPEGTQMVYSNWTPRSNRYFPDAGAEKRNEFRYNSTAITCSKVRDLTTGRNPKGIKNLSENFNHVWFTNSYKDWDNLPENVTMFKVI